MNELKLKMTESIGMPGDFIDKPTTKMSKYTTLLYYMLLKEIETGSGYIEASDLIKTLGTSDIRNVIKEIDELYVGKKKFLLKVEKENKKYLFYINPVLVKKYHYFYFKPLVLNTLSLTEAKLYFYLRKYAPTYNALGQNGGEVYEHNVKVNKLCEILGVKNNSRFRNEYFKKYIENIANNTDFNGVLKYKYKKGKRIPWTDNYEEDVFDLFIGVATKVKTVKTKGADTQTGRTIYADCVEKEAMGSFDPWNNI